MVIGSRLRWCVCALLFCLPMIGFGPPVMSAHAQPPVVPPAPPQTPQVLPTTKVIVSPLFYVSGRAATATSEAREAYGVCDDFELTVGGYAPGTIRIGVLDSQIGGSSRLWHATTWQAALTASQLLNYNPRATQAILSVRGNIDGPSAGALLTVGVLAGARGDKLDPAMTMTGTINPDGEIGSVAGIPYKIEGAARAGKKVVLIPKMEPLEYDERQDKAVDLIAHGKKHGVDVRLVNNVWQAYAEFTGKELPRPDDVPPPPLPARAGEHMGKRVDRWLAIEASTREKYESWGQRGQNDYADALLEEAAEFREKAERLRGQGQFAAALADAQWAAINGTTAHQVGRCEYVYAGGGLKAVQDMLTDDDWVESESQKLQSALKFFRPATLQQLPYYMFACDQYFVGMAIRDLSDAIAENLPDDEEQATVVIVEAAQRQALAWLAIKLSYGYLELANLEGGQPIPQDAPLDELAELYLRCAEANQAVVDEIVVTPVAEEVHQSHEVLKARLAIKDPIYGINALVLKSFHKRLDEVFGDTEQLKYARLGAALSLNTRSAMLITKYSSLDAKLDSDLNITDIANEPALSDWLDDSRSQARRAIHALVESGVDHTGCTHLYAIARIKEGRGLDGRLEALQYYFDINVFAQVLGRIAGE